MQVCSPRHATSQYTKPIFFQQVGEIDSRGPSDYVSAAANGDMDDAEEDDANGTVGSPVLLKSLGNKRSWDDEHQKVHYGNTVSCRLATTFH
jgi:hypothetical protein